MREVECSLEASSYIEDNQGYIPQVWTALFMLRDTVDLPGEPTDEGLIIWEIPGHWIYYYQRANGAIVVVVIQPKP